MESQSTISEVLPYDRGMTLTPTVIISISAKNGSSAMKDLVRIDVTNMNHLKRIRKHSGWNTPGLLDLAVSEQTQVTEEV
jgi:hypothetical protein